MCYDVRMYLMGIIEMPPENLSTGGGRARSQLIADRLSGNGRCSDKFSTIIAMPMFWVLGTQERDSNGS
jgi:hypothetical protein